VKYPGPPRQIFHGVKRRPSPVKKGPRGKPCGAPQYFPPGGALPGENYSGKGRTWALALLARTPGPPARLAGNPGFCGVEPRLLSPGGYPLKPWARVFTAQGMAQGGGSDLCRGQSGSLVPWNPGLCWPPQQSPASSSPGPWSWARALLFGGRSPNLREWALWVPWAGHRGRIGISQGSHPGRSVPLHPFSPDSRANEIRALLPPQGALKLGPRVAFDGIPGPRSPVMASS